MEKRIITENKRFLVKSRMMKNMKVCILFTCFFAMCINMMDRKVYGSDDVITTCIWATNFDNNVHWEYCTVHGEIRNKENHSYVDNWYLGSASCKAANYSMRICDCGYNYKYQIAHSNLSDWIEMTNRYIHYCICGECSEWIVPTRCYNEEGLMSCQNLGTCLACGAQPTKDMHYITTGGVCRDCGLKLINISEYKVEYAPDYSSCKIIYSMSSAYDGFVLSGNAGHSSNTINYKSQKWTSVKNSDGSYTYTGEFVFNPDTQRKCIILISDNRNVGSIGDTQLYIDQNIFHVSIWQDHEKPKITEIKEVDQKTSNTWATIKQLTINGTDNLSSVVKISIIDKETGEVIVEDAKTAVVNGTFTYTCTPPLEGPIEGREYICRVEDEVGNILEHPFTIYKTDSKAPRLVSDNIYTKWSQTKKIKLELEDYGAGSVQASITDQVSYLDTIYENGKYYAEYTFAEENYGTAMYNMYMRDGLGNATKTSLTVGKIDNTKPTIIDAVASRLASSVNVAITANDYSKKLNAEGSGVSRYAITDSILVPTDDKWQVSNDVQITRAGMYYLWVKDVAGNIGDALRVKVDDSLNTNLNIKDKYIYDKAKIDKDKVYKDKLNSEKLDKDMKDKQDTKEKDNKKDIDNVAKNDSDKRDLDDYDDTPKTGDNKDINVYMLYLIISFVGMATLISSRKRMVKNE